MTTSPGTTSGATPATQVDTTSGTALGTALRDVIDGRWAHVRREVRTGLDPAAFLPDPTLDTEQHRERVLGQMRLLAASPHARRGFPLSYGGEGDVGASVTTFEMLGHGDLSLMVKAGVHWGLFGGAVANLGTRRHHEQLLERIISFDLPGCFAMTETGHGSDVQSLGTTATYDATTDELVVHTPHPGARKDYIGGAARDGRLAVVFAQLLVDDERRGVHAVLVPIRGDDGSVAPGVAIEDCGPKAGLNGVDNGRLAFDHVRVPRTNLLNRYGDIDSGGVYTSPIDNPDRRFFTMLGTLVRGRISVAGGAAAATRTALTIAVRYAEVRRQFAAPGSDDEVALLDYRTHQRRLLPRVATSYAFAFAQNDLVEAMHEVQSAERLEDAERLDEKGQRELESRAAGIKALATWHATDTIQECREACGGAGYLAENRLPALKADTDVFTTFEGDNVVLLQLVTKGLLTGYRNAFGELDALGTARFVARQVASSAFERTGGRGFAMRLLAVAPRRRDDGADLLDRRTQLRLLADREQHLLAGLARRLRAGGRNDVDLFAVFNDAQDHVLTAARAHVQRIVLESFAAGIERCPDEAARVLLGQLCDLYVLSLVDRDRAWYVEHGRLTVTHSKAVTGQVSRLCAALRPHALALVEGFGIPDAWIGAPIATGAEAARQQAARQAH